MPGHHEPCAPDEIWVGNTLASGKHFEWLKSKGLSTLRLGSIAFDIYGKPIADVEGYSPVFIHRVEEQRYNEIMMEKTFGPNWRRG